MNLSEEILNKINELAKALTPLSDVAVLLDLNPDDLALEMEDLNSPVRRAYERGRAETELAIRTSEINMAANGSPLAITHVNTFIKDLVMLNNL